MTRKKAQSLYPDLPVFTNWNEVPPNMATKTTLLKEGIKVGDPVGVFASRVKKDALYLLYRRQAIQEAEAPSTKSADWRQLELW